MFRRTVSVVLLAVSASAVCLGAESGQAALQNYFVGRQVRLKIDMPGTAKGVDLRVDAADPMDWKQYSSRLKESGPAIRTGDRSTVTTIVVKKNLIEFQLDGGGFGTFWDDTSTTVTPYEVGKSNYEKQLERDIKDTTDPSRKRDLQRELDRERSRRRREQAADDRAALIASQMKQQQVADKRMRGGSRFNLRWTGNVPNDQLTPDALMKLLDTFIDFGDLQAEKPIFSPNPTPAVQNVATGNAPANGGSHSPMTQLKRGMLIGEVSGLLGLGRQLSHSVSEEGLKTQIFEYLPDDYRVEVTYVDGVVVRYSISSR
jgi:hypothetical protein